MQSLASQFYAFIVTVLMGLTIGVLFDFYKFTKGMARPGKLLGYITDVLFWVVSTLTVFFLLLLGNWGDIRLYVVIGVIIGAAIYFKILSSLVLRILYGVYYYSKIIFRYCCRVLGIIWVAITYPFILLGNIIVIPIGYLSMAGAQAKGVISSLAGRVVVAPMSRFGKSIKNGIRRRWMSLFKKS